MPTRRPFTPEELADLQQRGFNTSSYNGEAVDFPDDVVIPAGQSSTGGAFIRGAAASAAPTAASGAGFAGGMALGGGPFTPLGWITGLGGSYLAGKLASKAQEAVIPESWEQQLAIDAQQHPYATTAGGIATMPLGGFNASPSTLARAAGALPKLAAPVGGKLALLPQEVAAIQNVGIGGGIGAVQELVTAPLEGRDITLGNVALNAALGGTFNKPNRIGRALGFHEPVVRPVDDPRMLEAALRRADSVLPPTPEQHDAMVKNYAAQIEARRIAAAAKLAEESRIRAEDFKKANAEMAVAKAGDLESVIKGNQLATKPEATVTPKVTELGKEIYPDYTGVTEADNAAVLAESAADLEMRRREGLGDRYQTEDVRSPLQKEVEELMAARKLPEKPTSTYNKAVDEVIGDKNVKVTDVDSLLSSEGVPIKGKANLGEEGREVLINKQSADASTRPHEGMHYVRGDLEALAERGDVKAKDLLNKWDNVGKAELEKHNEVRKKAGMQPWDAHEFAVSQQGYEFLKQQFNLGREKPLGKWWNDVKSLYKTAWSDKATSADLRRAMNQRFLSEKTQGVVGKRGPLGETLGNVGKIAPASRGQEDNFVDKLSKEGLDIKEWAPEGMKPHYQVTDKEGRTVYVPKEGATEELLRAAMKSKQEAFKGERNQEDTLTTGAAKMLEQPEKNKLPVNKQGVAQGTQLLSTLKNKLHPSEWKVLEEAGISKEFTGRIVPVKEVLQWVKKNGPRVEVKKYGNYNVSEESKKMSELEHSLDTVGITAKYNEHGDQITGWQYNGKNVRADEMQAPHAQKMVEMEKMYNSIRDDRKGTANWITVAPKPESSMPGYTEIAVVKPYNKAKGDGYDLDDPTDTGRGFREASRNAGIQFPSSHSFPPNTLGFVRGYMETLPNGKKVWHVIEVQSDWAQQHRKLLEEANKKKEQGYTGVSNQEYGTNRLYDPLLSHYERLALKSAIEHAREQGADAIAVSDAETAMMTEGHDRQVPFLVKPTPKNIELAKRVKIDREAKYKSAQLLDSLIAGREVEFVEGGLQARQLGFEGEYKPFQEGGMRMHYEPEKGTLHRIASELTGSKGEKVGFGEHKMALSDPAQYSPEARAEALKLFGDEKDRYRSDLIFRNPDGTPKTDVTAMMYPLDKVAGRLQEGDKFTLFNRHQEDNQHRRGFLKPLEASFDKVERVEPKVAEALRRWEKRRDELLGSRNTALVDLGKFDRDDVSDVMAKHREAYRTGSEPSLSVEEQKISDILSGYFTHIADLRREAGMKINEREAGKNKYYIPDQLNDATLDLFTNRPNSVEAKAAKREWAQHVADESKGAVKFEKALEDINDYVTAINAGDNNYLSVKFGAIREAAGFGLPESLRETDPVRTIHKYGRRAANDLAMFMELESKPDIAGPLRLIDPTTGERSKIGDDISATPEARGAMQWVTGNYGHKGGVAAKINAFTRLVHNSILGPATGLRDTATIPLNAIPYLNSFADLGTFFKGISKFREHSRDALKTGARQPSVDKLVFDEVLQSPDRFTSILGKAADVMRKGQGREAIENFNRDVTFAIGKELAIANVVGAKNGNKKAELFLKKFSTLVDGDVIQMEGQQLEKAINQMAKNFTDRNQGTYGGSGLPVGMVDSSLAPFLSLQKWSVEKSNVIWKDVIQPFMDGSNRLPLLTYSLGTFMTGAAIQELNKLLTGRKSGDPEIKESLDKGDAKAIVSQLATLMQLGSFAGIVGDLTKAAADVTLHGKTPRNIVSFPAATAVLDMQEKVTDMLEALRQGENPWEVVKQFSMDMMTHNIQLARMVSNRTVKDEEIERSDKFRDRRVFNQLEGKRASDIPNSNRYLGMEQREFKQTGDVVRAVQLLPGLVQKAIVDSEGNPAALARTLQGLKVNNYGTMPDMEKDPSGYMKYRDYLRRTQGEGEASGRETDYLRQRLLNKVKGSVVPAL
jgi:hypothetical protein